MNLVLISVFKENSLGHQKTSEELTGCIPTGSWGDHNGGASVFPGRVLPSPIPGPTILQPLAHSAGVLSL